jgi:hypothetical protein
MTWLIPVAVSGVAPDKLFVPMMPEGTILTRHLSGIPANFSQNLLIEQSDHFGG